MCESVYRYIQNSHCMKFCQINVRNIGHPSPLGKYTSVRNILTWIDVRFFVVHQMDTLCSNPLPCLSQVTNYEPYCHIWVGVLWQCCVPIYLVTKLIYNIYRERESCTMQVVNIYCVDIPECSDIFHSSLTWSIEMYRVFRMCLWIKLFYNLIAVFATALEGSSETMFQYLNTFLLSFGEVWKV